MFGSLFYNVDKTHLRMLLNYEKINIVSSCGIIQKSHKILAEASAFVRFHMTLPGSLFYPTILFHIAIYPFLFHNHLLTLYTSSFSLHSTMVFLQFPDLCGYSKWKSHV